MDLSKDISIKTTILIVVICVILIGGIIIGYKLWNKKQPHEGEITKIPDDLAAKEMFKFLPSIPHHCLFYKYSALDDDGIKNRFYEINYCQEEALLRCYNWEDLSEASGSFGEIWTIKYYPRDLSLEKCINETEENPGRYGLDSRNLVDSYNKEFGPNETEIYHFKDKHTIYDVETTEEEHYWGKTGNIVLNCETSGCFENRFTNFTENSSLSLAEIIPAFGKVKEKVGEVDYFIHEDPSRFSKLYPTKIKTVIGCNQTQQIKYDCLSQEECKEQMGESACGSGRPYDGCTRTQTPKYKCSFIQKCKNEDKFCDENFNKAIKTLENYQWAGFELLKNYSSNNEINISFLLKPEAETRMNDLDSLPLNVGFGSLQY